MLSPNTSNPNSKKRINNRKKKPAQEPEENLDLIMRGNDWATSFFSPLSFNKKNIGLYSVSR